MRKILMYSILCSIFLFVSCKDVFKPQKVEKGNALKKAYEEATVDIYISQFVHPFFSESLDSLAYAYFSLYNVKVVFIPNLTKITKSYVLNMNKVYENRIDTLLADTKSVLITVPLSQYTIARLEKFDVINSPKLTNILDIETLRTLNLDIGTSDNKDYNLKLFPAFSETTNFFYNKNLFQELNIDPDKITNFELFLHAVSKIKSQQEKLQLDAVIGLAGRYNDFWGNDIGNLTIRREIFEETDLSSKKILDFTNENKVKIFLDMLANNTYSHVFKVSEAQQIQDFVNQKSAIILQSSSSMLSFSHEEHADFFQKNIGILPINLPDSPTNRIVLNYPLFWAINTQAPELDKRIALNFLEWLYLSVQTTEYILKETKVLPLYLNFDAYSNYSFVLDLFKYIDEHQYNYRTNIDVNPYWLVNVLGKNIKKYMQGNILWREAMQNSKKQWNVY